MKSRAACSLSPGLLREQRHCSSLEWSFQEEASCCLRRALDLEDGLCPRETNLIILSDPRDFPFGILGTVCSAGQG